MRGAVAGGHPLTAQAGARALAEGGNAVDACVAAAFASAVSESSLTGPGAGGFMLVHRARDRSTRLADFFVAAPGLGLRHRRGGEMQLVDVGFGEATTTQPFRIGPASCAVPGAVAGPRGGAPQRTAGCRGGSCSRPRSSSRATASSSTRPQAHMHALLDPILRSTAEGRRIYSNRERRRASSPARRCACPISPTRSRRSPAAARAVLYRGERARAIVATVRDGGGELTLDDLAAYRVVWRRPVRAPFRGSEFVSNPPPSSGGVLIAYGLALLERLDGRAAGQRRGDSGARRGDARADARPRRRASRAASTAAASPRACSRRRSCAPRDAASTRRLAGRPEPAPGRRHDARLRRRRRGERRLALDVDRARAPA